MTPKAGIFFSALIIAIGGIIYELLIATVSSYLLGDSVLQFSLTIGLFLFGMGIGSFLSPYLKSPPQDKFIWVETILAILGGNSVLILLLSFTFTDVFYLIFITLVVTIGILIGFEIPLMLRILQDKTHTSQIVSRILSLDYIGALIASIAFPIFLLPYFGIIRTSFLVGLLNALIALFIFISFYQQLSRKHLLGIFITIVIIILSVQTYFANTLAWQLDHHLYQDEIIYSQQTAYQKIVITKFKEDIRLFLNGAIQFSSIDEYRYHEPLIHVPVAATPHVDDVLVLGGGDGLAVRELLQYPQIKSITLVDIDPDMTSLASQHPLLTQINHNSLSNSKMTIINQDAFTFLNQHAQLYNLIIIDLPDPQHEAIAKLYTTEFYQLANRHLTADGVLVTQATSPYFSNRSFWMIHKTLESADLHTVPYHAYIPSFGDWGFILASPNPLDPDQLKLKHQGKFLSQENLPSLFIFEPDLQLTNEDYDSLPTNTLHTLPILQTYQQDENQWQPVKPI